MKPCQRDYFKVLCVGHSPDEHQLLKRAFTASGVCSIHYVTGGLEAIAYLMGEGKYSDRAQYAYPSFIITDLKMPGADGFDVLEHLKANPAWAIIPTIVLSGSDDPDDIRTAYMLGASSYHIKPHSFDQLSHQIKIIVDYWETCQIPMVDVTGKQLPTNAEGKLGERFPQPSESTQTRVKK